MDIITIKLDKIKVRKRQGKFTQEHKDLSKYDRKESKSVLNKELKDV